MNSILTPNFLLIAIGILGTTVIVLLILLFRINSKLNKFLIDIEAENIADSLKFLSEELSNLQKFQKSTEDYLGQTEKRLQKSIRSVHTVRFNPFHGTGEGGNQSFATAFLTEKGDGVLISSLYTRDKVSVFSKPIKNFTSEHGMSDEEKEALEKAREKITIS